MLIKGPKPYHPEIAARFVDQVWSPAAGKPGALTFEPLAGDGSDRRFIRVWAGRRAAVLVWGPDQAENRAYENIGRHLWRLNQAGPEFLAVDHSLGLVLIEDLGQVQLDDFFNGADRSASTSMYVRTIDQMAEVHVKGLEGFDPGWCFQTRRYDRELILKRETGYFQAAFVEGYLGLASDRAAFEREATQLADLALAGRDVGLMHRDFQSKNVMIKDGRPRLIDFQGARPGPPGYDLASLLYDPYVELPDDLRGQLLDYYLMRRGGLIPFDLKSFLASFPFLAACRLFQALGAYGYLCQVKGKKYFAQYMAPAVDRLLRLTAGSEFKNFKELPSLLTRIRLELP